MNGKNVELTDGVIVMHPFELENAEEHLAGEDDAQIRWLSGGKSTLESVRMSIERNQEHWKNGGPVLNLAIFDEENRLVGMVEANEDFERIEGLEKGEANIAYGLYPHARGKGYATRAVLLLVNWLKGRGIRRAVVRVTPENEASRRVALRCGFKEAAVITPRDGDSLIVLARELIPPSHSR